MSARPLIFGEVLFDHFPDGTRVLGGAPFNVAWHLQGFGLNPLFVSRVGKDADGMEIQDQMKQWGMDLAGLQLDSQFPTGQVSVQFHNQQPSYDILSQQAYDYIDADEMLHCIDNASIGLIYHGSLALREEQNFYTLQKLQDKLNTLVFVDINLRAPWWTSSLLDSIIQRAHWLKVNDEEIFDIAQDKSINLKKDLYKGAQELLKSYFLQGLILTLGEKGAALISADGIETSPSHTVENLVDTVGAGDAFASVCIVGLMQRWPAELILSRALAFAAKICGIRGATLKEQNFYQQVLQSWNPN